MNFRPFNLKHASILSSLLLSLSTPFVSFSNQDQSDSVPQKRIVPYGFVRSYLTFDSRRQLSLCGGEYSMIPYDDDWSLSETTAATLLSSDAVNDPDAPLRFNRNAVSSLHLLSLTTRMGINLYGADFLGFSTRAKIEVDFAGFGSNNTLLRLRLAYLNLQKSAPSVSHNLLIGQDYHPLSGDIMPDVLGFAAGAPFRPHSRTPQLRYVGSLLSIPLGFTAATLFQYQFTSPGPNGESADYANSSILPELFLGVHYGKPNTGLFTQFGLDYTSLRILTEQSYNFDSVPYPIQVDKRLSALSPSFYFQFVRNHFSIKFRTTYARNLGHLTMLSGYGAVVDSSESLNFTYLPTNSSVSYLNLCWGTRWKYNLFLGYQKNFGLGSNRQLVSSIDGSSDFTSSLFIKKGVNNINSIYRIAPSVCYTLGSVSAGIEYELTACTYGSLSPDGSVKNNGDLHRVINHRVLATMKFNF